MREKTQEIDDASPLTVNTLKTFETLIVVNFVLVKDCFNTLLLQRRGENRRGHRTPHIFLLSLTLYIFANCVCVCNKGGNIVLRPPSLSFCHSEGDMGREGQ